MTSAETCEVLHRVRYRDWWLMHQHSPDEGFLEFWWEFMAPDSQTEGRESGWIERDLRQSGRKWYVPTEDLTEETLVRLVFEAILKAEEHEAREFFRYAEKMVFNPHQALVAA